LLLYFYNYHASIRLHVKNLKNQKELLRSVYPR